MLARGTDYAGPSRPLAPVGDENYPPVVQKKMAVSDTESPYPGPGMGDLQPLMLVEVRRKLWVDMIIAKNTDIWEDECILAPTQHGFRRLRGTDSALLQVVNVLEQAHESQSPVYSSSWDIRRAFDSMTRPVMAMAWNHLVVPGEVANWLAFMDVDGIVMVKSPLALQSLGGPIGRFQTRNIEHLGFTCGMGTPRGDVSSPAA